VLRVNNLGRETTEEAARALSLFAQRLGLHQLEDLGEVLRVAIHFIRNG
jgi:uncharacterized protein (DUF2345 family)